MNRWAWRGLWLLLAAAGLYQLLHLAQAIGGRIGYPYDLEWMEGGLLHHADRVRHGRGVYVAPSVDFIPYLYTPLYPTLLAALGTVFGLSYALGRVVSVLALLGCFAVGVAAIVGPVRRGGDPVGPAWAAAALAAGTFAAAYPLVEGWYDLVRGDTLALFMVTLAIHLAARAAGGPRDRRAHVRVALVGALMALAFFCKQTAVLYVAFVGVVLVVAGWRRGRGVLRAIPWTLGLAYSGAAGVVGLGGAWLMQRASGGWFWTYVHDIHQTHDFNYVRFWGAFGTILWHFPAMTVVIAVVLAWSLVVAFARWRLPGPVRAFWLWTAAYAVSTLVGAIGYGTEFAHFNAYMPALLHGGIAFGAAIPAAWTCLRLVTASRPRWSLPITATLTATALAAGGWTLLTTRFVPHAFTPTAADRAAGDALLAEIRGFDGDVWMPSHPWYVHLAGKPMFVHRMGTKDVTVRTPRPIGGLTEAIRGQRFAAIYLDDRDIQLDGGPGDTLRTTYKVAAVLPPAMRPRLYSGAKVVPDTRWEPITAAVVPVGATALFAFEDPSWQRSGWQRSGAAWGNGPVAREPTGQGFVAVFGGRRFADSYGSGDASIGRVTSPEFALDGGALSMRLAGGTDATKLRVELWVDGVIARTFAVPPPAGELLREVKTPIEPALRGHPAHLVLVDEAAGSWGHLDVDDVLLWR